MRKQILLLILLACLTTAVTAQSADDVVRLSEPVQVTETHEQFGEKMDPAQFDSANTLSELIESGDTNGPVTIKTEIATVCKRKGCFFVASDGKYTARVTFKDYSFFIPTDSQGKEVLLHGEFSVKTVTEEQAKHYAEDAGEDPNTVTGDQKEYSVVASSILVPRS